MRRRRDIGFVVGVLVAGALAMVLGGGMASGASTANTTVSVTVASATSLNAAGCASGTSNVTDFGTVLPATSNVTSVDCSVVFGSSNDTSMLRAYQSDRRWTSMFGLPDGTLDTTFDSDGFAITNFTGTSEFGNAVAVQDDGKVVVAGATFFGSYYDIAVARYNTNGSLDVTFSGDGKQTTSIGNNDYAYAVAIQPDGKIVVAGTSAMPAYDFSLVRYNSDGTLDTTFSGDGIQTTNVLATDEAHEVLIQPDGKIVAAGWCTPGMRDFAAVRYNADGSLDTTFSGDGMVNTDVNGGGGTDEGYAAALRSDGVIVVAGMFNSGSGLDYAVAQYGADGTLDTSFSGDGKLTFSITASNDVANSVLFQPDGKIVAAGYAGGVVAQDFAIARLNADGTLDAAFDTDGKQTTPIGSGTDGGNEAALQADGKIVVAGFSSNGADDDLAIVRYTSAGALDTAFSGDGKLTHQPGTNFDDYMAVVVQPDGRIVAAGHSVQPGIGYDFVVARYGSPPIADWAGSWGAANLFGACLHTVANASNTWALAGAGNCTTAIDANWNALPTTASKIAFAGSGVTNATANLRYGFKATASQQAGLYIAPLTFEVVAPNA